MKKMLQKRNALKNKKGFTLIEIIVVLVIIAILAAATIPAMLGFVNDARIKAHTAELRTGNIAAQAIVTEAVATNGTAPTKEVVADMLNGENGKTKSELVADITDGRFSDITISTENRVTAITYTPTTGSKKLVLTGGKVEVQDK